MAPGPATVEVAGVSHRYAGAHDDALRRVSVTIEAGRRVGLLGPNGAGKSTLMRLVCGYLPVQAGAIIVGGRDVMADALGVRRTVGYMPETVPLYPELRVREHLRFRARIKGVPRWRPEVQRVAERTGLADRLETPVGHLSRGYRQRVGIADALLGSPPLVILDEPTVGLDPNQVQDIRALLRELAGEQTLVFSSHILAEVELLCDDVIILSQGRVVAAEPLATATAGRPVEAEWDGAPEDAAGVVAAVLERVPGRVEWVGDGARARLWSDAGDPDALRRAVGQESLARGVALVALAVGRDRLEETFARLTRVDAGAEAPP